MDHGTTVLALEERRRQAMLAGDVSTLQALLADDLAYVHSSGGLDTQASYLAKLADGRLRYLEVDLLELQVQCLREAAVVRGRMAARILMDGQPRTVASKFMTVWGRGADGNWRLHAHQGTPVGG